jgi:hypothetical protein
MATDSTSRYSAGGFSERFAVIRLDGRPTRPTARYIVLDYSGADPHAVVAMKAYAASVRAENPGFADDIEAALANPGESPAQHPCADNKR